MKNNVLAFVLVAALLVTVLLNALFAFRYVQLVGRVASGQMSVTQANLNRQMVQRLAQDALDYSVKNPTINPVLYATGIKAPVGGVTTNRPAAR